MTKYWSREGVEVLSHRIFVVDSQCPGSLPMSDLAMAEIRIILTHLLFNFNVQFGRGNEQELGAVKGLVHLGQGTFGRAFETPETDAIII